jgi:hypothetical protein
MERLWKARMRWFARLSAVIAVAFVSMAAVAVATAHQLGGM